MNNVNFRKVFSDLPTIETERLLLKKIVMDNAEDMYSYASLDTVTRYLLWTPHLNMDDTRGYIEFLERQYKRGNYADWGITLKEENTFIGTVGFADIDFNNNIGELGYVLNPLYQGRGYMSEAVNEILKMAFTVLEFDKVVLRIMEENNASIRFAKRNGFSLERIGDTPLLVKGEERIIHYYSLTKEKWKK